MGGEEMQPDGAFVYILKCVDGAYYVGSHRGDDVARRVWEHNAAFNPRAWTARRRPVELVWSAHFPQIDDAVSFEFQIKKWTRAKKEALIAGDWSLLKTLAVSKSAPADPTRKTRPF